MEESEREVISEISCDQKVSLTACKQQGTGGKDGADTDKKLDISSDQFDPLLALYSSDVPLPYPNIRCFNNLAEYESFMKGGRGRAKPVNVEKRIRKAKRGVADPERIERLKKLMVKNPCGGEEGESGVKRPAKHRAPKNVLTRMPLHEGSPLGELNRCVQQRLRVKVHIRSFKGLRGVCTGFLVAFDKFWNLAMVDVDETYREPLLGEAFYHEKALTVTRLFQKLQVQAASGKAAEAETSKADEPRAEPHNVTTSSMLGVRASRQAAERLARSVKVLAVTSTDMPHISAAGSEQRQKVSKPRVEYGRVRTRHINQLFIRGENVLLVNIQE
ncbi:U7 snRNA-associated Sm-like protein LSm11 isoform X1 [Ictalurus furcatus]|uniref:U7 snRNA-associated Sm-like protein LSm11 isoform X1 n=1 Tax=Ictalurus furcatus TaxID=66913 RepID=UPI00234FF85B|nr:U7 snRNA-associated Sm-like protein LSm11 isoform X1 [Ictalurus furcatus]